jgi:D-mannonate dehydratase
MHRVRTGKGLNSCIGSLVSVNNIKDVTKDYDDIINGFHFRRISCFSYHSVEKITQKALLSALR